MAEPVICARMRNRSFRCRPCPEKRRQDSSQFLPRPRYLILDRLRSDPAYPSRLRVGIPVGDQAEGFTLCERKYCERMLESFLKFASQGHQGCVFAWLAPDWRILIEQSKPASALGDEVSGAAAGGLAQIRGTDRLEIKVSAPPPDRDEQVLSYVLGIGMISSRSGPE